MAEIVKNVAGLMVHGRDPRLEQGAQACDDARTEIEALTAENNLLREERDQAIYERDEARAVGQ
jgi:hypothetical protein